MHDHKNISQYSHYHQETRHIQTGQFLVIGSALNESAMLVCFALETYQLRK